MAVATATAKNVQAAEGLYTWPYRFEIVALQELEVDARYQRPLTTFWKTVSEKFNPALVGTLIVSERGDGSKHIIDGQTRWKAMDDQGLPGAPCLIYEGLTMQQEAELFALLQTQRRGMRTYDRFRAQLVAKNPMAVGISRVVQDSGFDLSTRETPNTMQAIAALERAYRIDPDHLADVLTVIRNVWGVENRDAVSAQIIQGLSFFLRTQEKIDYERLEARLRDVTPRLIQNQASQIREGAGPGTGTGRSVSQAILNIYMRKR